MLLGKPRVKFFGLFSLWCDWFSCFQRIKTRGVWRGGAESILCKVRVELFDRNQTALAVWDHHSLRLVVLVNTWTELLCSHLPKQTTLHPGGKCTRVQFKHTPNVKKYSNKQVSALHSSSIFGNRQPFSKVAICLFSCYTPCFTKTMLPAHYLTLPLLSAKASMMLCFPNLLYCRD